MLHFKLIRYFFNRGFIAPGSRVMDVGTQNIMFVAEEDAIDLIRLLRRAPISETHIEEVRRISYYSTPRPGERTAFLHELLALTDVQYDSVDVADGLKTTIFDLNTDKAPKSWCGEFDFLLNCGTLEHILNQSNALDFIHTVLKPGGLWFDQPPTIGFLNHGYYNYHPLFYKDFAAANGYDILETWYSVAGAYAVLDNSYPVVDVGRIDEEGEFNRAKNSLESRLGDVMDEKSTSYNLNVTMKKIANRPLKYPLEVRTTHNVVDKTINEKYSGSLFNSH